jgi:hypothetical protein
MAFSFFSLKFKIGSWPGVSLCLPSSPRMMVTQPTYSSDLGFGASGFFSQTLLPTSSTAFTQGPVFTPSG